MPYKFLIDATVKRKLRLIERCLPVYSAIDFGGMWEVDGFYSKQCAARFGIKRVTMVDAEESMNWKADPGLREGLDFRKGDFSDDTFMRSIRGLYDLGIAFDVLLHQIDLRHTLSMMLSKVKRFFLISNPVVTNRTFDHFNSLVLLSGSKASDLIPFRQEWTNKMNYWRNFRDASNVKSNHWLWAMSPSFITSLMTGLGWRLAYGQIWKDRFLENPRWRMAGFIFKKYAR